MTERLTDEALARFNHHPDPAIDFCIEVETLESRLHQAELGLSKPGTQPETVQAVYADICRAMDFTVGGDAGAVDAKAVLRDLARRATPADDLRAAALRDADEVTALIVAGKRIPRGMTESLRNHVQRLCRHITSQPAPAPQSAYDLRASVTPLEWEEYTKGSWIGTPPVRLGSLAFWVFLDGEGRFKRAVNSGWEFHTNLDAAKASAQADYAARVIAALSQNGGAA